MSLISFAEKFIKPFFLPVVTPPEHLLSNPLTYYGDLEALGVGIVASSAGPGSPLEILIENPDTVYPVQDGKAVSTVLAMTSGFVGLQQGELVLRVWTADFNALDKQPNGPPRANRIVFGSVDPSSIEVAIKLQIAALTDRILEESWTQGSTDTPPARAGLEGAFLQRFLAGDAEIFVKAGTPLGTAASIVPITDPPVARLTLQTFFEAPDTAMVVAPEDLIDNVLRPVHLTKFTRHPLLRAISGPVSIRFRSRFFVWDNTPGARDYKPLENADVTLFAGPDLTNPPDVFDDVTTTTPVISATTDAAGYIDLFAPPIPSRAMIHFRYATTGRTFGLRAYAEDVATNAHKARQHLDASFENTKDYRAKYEIYPKYRDFTDDLAAHEDDEKYGEDRGNMSKKYDRFTNRELMKHIAAFEACYKADVIPAAPATFNLLVEGDSWLNYPFAFNDIYGHLDQILWARKKPEITYNRVPLQHYGDRADQMFYAASPTADRQWTYTRDFLAEYKFDLILASGGGNDMAEPGIGPTDERYAAYMVEGCFDPFAASAGSADMATAERLMGQSFAILLRNHPWHAYATAEPLRDEATLSARFDDLFAAMGKDFGPSNREQQALSLQEIGHKVIAGFPDDVTLGDGSLEAQLIEEVFDVTAFNLRYASVKNNWQILLDEAALRQIPVISHTYGYPLFNEDPTSALGFEQETLAGPWFITRFSEAKITDRRVQKICLKVILDKFVTDVLVPLKSQYPLFDYVDIRNLNSSTDVWRDEMHLSGRGYRKIARKIYDLVAANPALSPFFS